MTLNVGRITVWAVRGKVTRPEGELGKRFTSGGYGAWSLSLVNGPWFVLSAWRRYPDSRIRCPKCGYRELDG